MISGMSDVTDRSSSAWGQLSRSCVKFHNAVQQWKRISSRGLKELQSISQSKLPGEREKSISNLLASEQELCGIVQTLNRLCANIKASTELLCKNDDVTLPLTIYAHCGAIQRSYNEELTIRKMIVQDVAIAGNEVKTSYSTTWLYEPFISCANCDHLLQLVLVMSGNKNAD